MGFLLRWINSVRLRTLDLSPKPPGFALIPKGKYWEMGLY